VWVVGPRPHAGMAITPESELYSLEGMLRRGMPLKLPYALPAEKFRGAFQLQV
jgi:hypothetical protein